MTALTLQLLLTGMGRTIREISADSWWRALLWGRKGRRKGRGDVLGQGGGRKMEIRIRGIEKNEMVGCVYFLTVILNMRNKWVQELNNVICNCSISDHCANLPLIWLRYFL